MQKVQQQIDLSQSAGLVCQHCQGIFFRQSVLLRKFSRIYTMTPDDVIMPVAVFMCEQCNEPCLDYFPRGMQDIEAKLGIADPVPVSDAPKSKLIQM